MLSGAVIGLLGGLVGLILGSLRMPALLRWVGETPQQAVGTNVTVGVFVGVAGALAHLPNAAPDLDVIARRAAPPRSRARCSARASPGGSRTRRSIKAIAVVLLIAAAGCIVQALT